MGWAHESAAISLTARTATWTRAVGLGGGGWSQQPLAGLMKSPGRLARSLGRVLGSSSPLPQSPGRARLWQFWSRPPKSLFRLPELWSRIRRLREEPAQKWSLMLVKA